MSFINSSLFFLRLNGHEWRTEKVKQMQYEEEISQTGPIERQKFIWTIHLHDFKVPAV